MVSTTTVKATVTTTSRKRTEEDREGKGEEEVSETKVRVRVKKVKREVKQEGDGEEERVVSPVLAARAKAIERILAQLYPDPPIPLNHKVGTVVELIMMHVGNGEGTIGLCGGRSGGYGG